MANATSMSEQHQSRMRSWSPRHIEYVITAMIGLGGFAAAFVLIGTGVGLGRTFGNAPRLDAPALFGSAPSASYPCGVDIPCFEKGRYQPIWL